LRRLTFRDPRPALLSVGLSWCRKASLANATVPHGIACRQQSLQHRRPDMILRLIGICFEVFGWVIVAAFVFGPLVLFFIA
jgi:hypothetical protein